MKRLVLCFILATFLFSVGAVIAPSSSSGGGGGGWCSDSDGGLDYNNKGEVTNSNGDINTDYCIDQNTLKEYSCGETVCNTVEECTDPEPQTTQRLEIQVIYNIETAQSIFDGEDMGTTTIGFTKSFLSEDLTHSLVVKKEGYKDCSRDVTLFQNKSTKVYVTLKETSSEDDCNVSIENGGDLVMGGGGSRSCSQRTICERTNNDLEYSCSAGSSCLDGACIPGSNTSQGETSMDTCLDDSSKYWDQKTDRCKSGYSESLISSLCSDPDGGSNYYEEAHTFGFRSYSTATDPSRDLRIRTGGRDYCDPESRQLHEHYCSEEGYIQTLYFTCPNGCSNTQNACIPGDEISEEITCIFEDSEIEQSCYIAGSFTNQDEGTKLCYGENNCKINFTSYEGEEITWKSTCGGYEYSTIDGIDETLNFYCKGGEVDEDYITSLGFKEAYWECYDGAENEEESETCISSSEWKDQATAFCEGHCYEDGSKCGVNSFGVSNECYLAIPSVPALPGTSLGDDVTICRDACPKNRKCYPFGHRKSGEFCSDTGSFIEQLESGNTCENNFECDSNVCVDGECISSGLIRSFIDWFKSFFN
jgi:hypothetical protein